VREESSDRFIVVESVEPGVAPAPVARHAKTRKSPWSLHSLVRRCPRPTIRAC